MDYSRFLTDVAKKRKGTMLRELFNLQVGEQEGWIYVIGGLPNESLFPFVSGDLNLSDGTKMNLNETLMRDALQYGPSGGYPPLIKQLEEMVKIYHAPSQWEDRKLIVTNGVQDGLAKALELMMNTGDYVLLEEPVYSAMLSVVLPYSPRFITMETDEKGLKPESMRAALSRWRPEEMSKADKDVPKFFYTNPTGCNPTGSILPTERRKEIYKICCEYNLIILEDDPYYFQQYTPEEEYPPSFLQLDTENRVIRFDSFSKVVGGGLRTGFLVGPKPLVEKILIHQQITCQHASNISQVMLYQLLSTWGKEGFEKHVKKLKDFYIKQRDEVVISAKKHLQGLCEWSVPAGGLFFWIKVSSIPNVSDMIMAKAASQKVILVPGNCFMVDSTKPCPYIRFAFSHNSIEKLDEAIRRFAEMIREEMKTKSPKG